MGILDDMVGAVDRGVTAVGRTTKSAQLKMQLSDLGKRRRDLAAQLGASLYEATKNDAAMRMGREELYEGIASIDRQCGELTTQIKAIEDAVQKPAMAATSFTCHRCSSVIGAADLFCHGCGMSAEDARAIVAPVFAPTSSTLPATVSTPCGNCPNCAAPIGDGDEFCMNCGSSLAKANAPADVDMASESRSTA